MLRPFPTSPNLMVLIFSNLRVEKQSFIGHRERDGPVEEMVQWKRWFLMKLPEIFSSTSWALSEFENRKKLKLILF
jgi:hypothetical protein